MDDNATVEVSQPTESAVTEAAVSTPAPDTPVVDTAPAQPATPEAPKSRRDVIEQAMKTSGKGRHAAYQPREAGRFAPGAPKLPEAAVANPQTVGLANHIPAQPSRPAMLKSLKKEVEAHWNQAHPELLQEFVRREADYEKGIDKYRTDAQSAREVLDQFKPYEWILRNEGATPAQAVANLMQTAAILRTGSPEQKAQSVANVMRQFGIPIESVNGYISGGQPQADPQYNYLTQQVSQLTQMMQNNQAMQNQHLETRAVSAIQQFAADPKNVHFDALQDKMSALLQTPQLIGIRPDMSEREKLQVAYDAAVRLDPQIHAQTIAQQQSEAERAKREQAQNAVNTARAAAVQVRGAPSQTPVTVNGNNRRDVIANALRAAQN